MQRSSQIDDTIHLLPFLGTKIRIQEEPLHKKHVPGIEGPVGIYSDQTQLAGFPKTGTFIDRGLHQQIRASSTTSAPSSPIIFFITF